MKWRPYSGVLKQPMVFDPAQSASLYHQTATPQLERIIALYQHYGLSPSGINNPFAGDDYKLVRYLGFRHAGFETDFAGKRERMCSQLSLDPESCDFRLAMHLAGKYVPGFRTILPPPPRKPSGRPAKLSAGQLVLGFFGTVQVMSRRRRSLRSAAQIVWKQQFREHCSEETFRQHMQLIYSNGTKEDAVVRRFYSEFIPFIEKIYSEQPEEIRACMRDIFGWKFPET